MCIHVLCVIKKNIKKKYDVSNTFSYIFLQVGVLQGVLTLPLPGDERPEIGGVLFSNSLSSLTDSLRT